MPGSRWSDLERPPLDAQALRRALLAPSGPWTSLEVLATTGSTNADLVARARAGAPAGAVLVAEEQTAGQGRLDRRWVTPPRAALAVSMLLRPPVPARRWGWLSLLVGLAATDAVRRVAELDAVLKWPNDVLVGERKLAGVLIERVDAPPGPAAVVGIGLNVSLAEDELPVPEATSLRVAGAEVIDRDPLLRALLRAVAGRYEAWVGADGDATACGLRAAYVDRCMTLGRPVTVHLPAGRREGGVAGSVDETGALVVRRDDGTDLTVTAGDVVHVRPGAPD
ncbi:MAG TPA: biotin--[acetyl-CoA-carboxylase] ligase [Actinomycetes bacterium]|nr:biotin--[acetyl-CoA-carboxylase] ligase [Actinomycetes bacterium]